MESTFHATTILAVRQEDRAVLAGDGQVTLGSEVLKASAKKLRRLYGGKIVAGFAGATADAFALFARFETKLEQYNGNLSRSVVELAKDWRTDRMLRHLEALLLVADKGNTYLVSGNGDVIEPDEAIATNVINQVGNSNLVFSTDYPHVDSRYPEAVNYFLKLPLSEDDKRKILWDNCRNYYAM